MARYAVGDTVKVTLPKGASKRGVMGVHVMYTTSQEAKFEGASGTVKEVNPRGPYGSPLYLVDFRGHDNRVAIPWQAHWFRPEWLELVKSASEAEEAEAATEADSAKKIAGPAPVAS